MFLLYEYIAAHAFSFMVYNEETTKHCFQRRTWMKLPS